MIVYHHNDLDGRCSAAIVWQYAPPTGLPCSIKEVDYKDTINFGDIKPNETVYILDFSFKPEVMENLLNITSNVIWIDHHKTAIESLKVFDYLTGYRISDEYAGCELTWMYFHPNKHFPYAVALLGDYDKWALKHQPACFEFYEGLKLEDTQPQAEIWNALFQSNFEADKIIANGKLAIRYRDNYCSQLRKSFGYEAIFPKLPHLKIYACNMYMFGSKGFGDLFNKYDIVIAYIYDGLKYQVSLYSDNRVDVETLCKQFFDGGGHTGAAGFVCKELPFKPVERKEK